MKIWGQPWSIFHLWFIIRLILLKGKIQSASCLLHPQGDTACFLSTTHSGWYSLLPVYYILRVIQSISCVLHSQGDTVCFLSTTPSGWYSLLPVYYSHRVGMFFDHVRLWLIQHSISVFSLLVLHVLFRGWLQSPVINRTGFSPWLLVSLRAKLGNVICT